MKLSYSPNHVAFEWGQRSINFKTPYRIEHEIHIEFIDHNESNKPTSIYANTEEVEALVKFLRRKLKLMRVDASLNEFEKPF